MDEQRPKVEVKEYGLGFTISGPDHPMSTRMADDLARAIDDHRRNLVCMVTGVWPEGGFPKPKPVPRWKRWLGQKLYDWALDLYPDLYDG